MMIKDVKEKTPPCFKCEDDNEPCLICKYLYVCELI